MTIFVKTEPSDTNKRNKLLRWLLYAGQVVLAIGICVYLVRSGWVNIGSMKQQILAHPALCLAALGLHVLAFVLSSIRLIFLLRTHRPDLAYRHGFILDAYGYIFTVLLPGTIGGDVAKSVYIFKNWQELRGKMIATLLVNRYAGMVGLFAAGLLFMSFAWDLLLTSALLKLLLVVLALCFLLLLVIPFLGRIALAKLSPILPIKRTGRMMRLLTFLDESLFTFSPCVLIISLFLSILIHSSLFLSYWLFYEVLSNAAVSWNSIMTVLALAPLLQIVRLVPITPNGIGTVELASTLLIKEFQMTLVPSISLLFVSTKITLVILLIILMAIIYILGISTPPQTVKYANRNAPDPIRDDDPGLKAVEYGPESEINRDKSLGSQALNRSL